MTSCPAESELVLLVDGDLAADREAAVLDHLVICDDCLSLLGRTEAALRYALGGLADAGEVAAPVATTPAVLPRRPARARPMVLAAALLATAVVFGGVHLALRSPQSTMLVLGSSQTRIVPTPAPAAIVPGEPPDALDALLARAERLAAPAPSRLSQERDLLALGALAAAETRGSVLGAAPEAAGLRDVVATFPGTAGARVAAQRLAALEESR